MGSCGGYFLGCCGFFFFFFKVPLVDVVPMVDVGVVAAVVEELLLLLLLEKFNILF